MWGGGKGGREEGGKGEGEEVDSTDARDLTLRWTFQLKRSIS